MPNTKINVTSSGTGVFAASPDSAPFHAGDTITFVSSKDAGDALVCFSDNAANALTPSSDTPVPLTAGSSITFKVSSAPESGCCVSIVSQGHQGTPDCPGIPAGLLRVTTANRRPVPSDPGQH